MIGFPCRHCRVRTPPRELTRGFCHKCFADEAEELPPLETEAIERGALYRARRAGLRAFGRVCGHEKCSCSRLRKEAPPAVAAQRRITAVFTDGDERDLHTYFGPTSSGQSAYLTKRARSGMRVVDGQEDSEAPNWKTTEIPSRTEPGCPICWKPLTPGHDHPMTERRAWIERPLRVYDTEVGGQLIQVHVYAPTQDPETRTCELVEHCSGSSSVHFRAAEIDMINEVGGRDRKTRVHRVLSRVPSKHAEVLEARYAPNQELASADATLGIYASVALLTDTLYRERAESSESPRSALAKLTHDSVDQQVSQVRRDEIRKKLETIRDEAQVLLLRAQQSYAKVAWELGL